MVKNRQYFAFDFECTHRSKYAFIRESPDEKEKHYWFLTLIEEHSFQNWVDNYRMERRKQETR